MPSLNDVTKRASKGSLDPVYVLVGTERLLIERVVDAVRRAVDSMGAPGFNVEVFDGKGLEAELKNGILHLTLPKAPGHKPQKIEVRSVK